MKEPSKRIALFNIIRHGLILIFGAILMSCVSQTGQHLQATKRVFHIPAITLEKPVENLGYKVPLTSVKLSEKRDYGTVIKSRNTNGFEAYRAIIVNVNKIKKQFAYIVVDDYCETAVLNPGDQLLDHVTETLQDLNKRDHQWLKDCFQRGKNLE